MRYCAIIIFIIIRISRDFHTVEKTVVFLFLAFIFISAKFISSSFELIFVCHHTMSSELDRYTEYVTWSPRIHFNLDNFAIGKFIFDFRAAPVNFFISDGKYAISSFHTKFINKSERFLFSSIFRLILLG